MTPRHLDTDSTQARAVREGHLDLDSSASMLAALDRLRELEEWESESRAGLAYVKSFPHAFGATFCLDHTEDGYSTCVWDDPDLLHEALYDLDLHCKNPTGKRRAHILEAVSA